MSPGHPRSQANTASFILTPICAERGDTEMERRIAYAYFTGYSLICLPPTEYYAGGYGGPHKIFLNGMDAPPSKVFLFIEPIKFIYTEERGLPKGAFSKRTFG